MDEAGIEVVLSPLQLAAVLEGESVEESSCLSKRFTGAATLVGGALELVGAAALILAPEPTMVTKVAGWGAAVHGSSVATSGLMQVISCQTHTTLTSQGVAAAAKVLGADPQAAASVAMAIDIAVPMGAGFVAAARAIAVRRGVIRLVAEEAAGGHTIARHVGRTEAQLRQRLVQQPAIPAASTFKNLTDAERAVSAAIRANRNAIRTWASTATPGTTKTLNYAAGRVIGEGVVRSTGKLTPMTNVVVVLRKVVSANRIYFVLTAYPKP